MNFINGTNYIFCIEMEVRDYECDVQEIVNNSVYLNYLEHSRHMFLKSQNICFVELSKNSTNLVACRIEIDYLASLRSGDKFTVCLNLERVSKMRFGFRQDIYRLSDNKQTTKSFTIVTAVDENSKPSFEALEKLNILEK